MTVVGVTVLSPAAKVPEATAQETSEPVLVFVRQAEEPEAPAAYEPDPVDVELIGRTIWGEAGGIADPAERAAVAWCILNRADAWGQSVEEVVTAPQQFHGYRATGDCPEEHLELARDVLTRWQAEKDGAEDVGRVLPAGYLYFHGDGEHNYFTEEWRSGLYYDWTLTSPY